MDDLKKAKIPEIVARHVDALRAHEASTADIPEDRNAWWLAYMISAFSNVLLLMEDDQPLLEDTLRFLMTPPADLCRGRLDFEDLRESVVWQATYTCDLKDADTHMRSRVLDCIRTLAVEGQSVHVRPLPSDTMRQVLVVGMMLAVMEDLKEKREPEAAR